MPTTFIVQKPDGHKFDVIVSSGVIISAPKESGFREGQALSYLKEMSWSHDWKLAEVVPGIKGKVR